jgi:hypothetical protein
MTPMLRRRGSKKDKAAELQPDPFNPDESKERLELDVKELKEKIQPVRAVKHLHARSPRAL